MNTENAGNDDDFEAFAAAGDVEVGEGMSATTDDDKPASKTKTKESKADADDKVDDTSDDNVDEADNEGDDDKPEKKPRKASDRIRELNKRLRESERRYGNLEAEITEIKNKGLPTNSAADKSSSQDVPAPDPSDTDRYPLGHLDDRYIEDKLEWLATKKAAERADAVLHRQQESEQAEAAKVQQQTILAKVDDLAERGSDLHDDFQELVVDAGMRGDWDLSQTTFEACHEAENGAQILLALAQDKKEATRVANLSAYGQLKYVQDCDAEIGKDKSPRRKPQAGEPPKNTARGANSRVQGNPATNDLDDFEKQWEREAKRNR